MSKHIAQAQCRILFGTSSRGLIGLRFVVVCFAMCVCAMRVCVFGNFLQRLSLLHMAVF